MHPCPCWARLSHIIRMNEDYLTACHEVVLPSYFLSHSLHVAGVLCITRGRLCPSPPNASTTNDLSHDVQTYYIVSLLPSV
jgi:hypothetical protein